MHSLNYPLENAKTTNNFGTGGVFHYIFQEHVVKADTKACMATSR